MGRRTAATRRAIGTELVHATIAGMPGLVEVPIVPARAPQDLAEGLERRRTAAILGRCPCGATRQHQAARNVRPDAAAGTPNTHTPFNHTGDCPAHGDLLGPAIDAWTTTTKGGGRGVARTR